MKLKLKLKQKFLFSYFLLILIPLIILSSLTYSKVSEVLESYITYSTKQAFDQTYSFLSYKLFRINEIANIITNDSNVSSILVKDPNTCDLHEQLKDMNYLRPLLISFQNNVDISKVRLYIKDNFIYSSDKINLFTISQAMNSKWHAEFKEIGNKNLWCPTSYLEDINPSGPKLLSVTAAIKNPDNFPESIGFLRLDFEKNSIDDIMKNTNTTTGSFTYIQNSKGIIIASSNDSLIDKYVITAALATSLASNLNSLVPVNINNNKCLVASSLINNTDWYMITVVPYESIVAKIKDIKYSLIAILSIIGTIAFGLAYYFSNSLTKPIFKLIKAMRTVHDGDLDTFVENSSNDEIGELVENYNFMISQMAILVEDKYKSGKEVKNAELKALQAQINPHFLYNTLDMINWMSFKNMNKEISLAVKSLASFYKLSLNKGKNIVSIKDELAHLSFYVNIQNMRYSNRIGLTINIPDVLNDYGILKITLQPIVENSILHGILGKENTNGEILINGELKDGDITIFVTDDGIGIPEDKIDKILTGNLSSNIGSSYGLKNIHKRIQLTYGANYGLTFKSQYGQGTTVAIKIPANLYEEGELI